MDLSRPFKDPKGRKQTVSLMAKKNFKQFLLVIDWLHPLPEGHKNGFNYEFFDTLEELKARAFELMAKKNEAVRNENWSVFGLPHHVEAMKIVDYTSSKKSGWTVVAYEVVAVMWGAWELGNHERSWIVKEWCSEEEWERFSCAGEKAEAIHRYEDDSFVCVNFGWEDYENVKASDVRKTAC